MNPTILSNPMTAFPKPTVLRSCLAACMMLMVLTACEPTVVGPGVEVIEGAIDTDRTLTDRESDPDKADYCISGTLDINARLTIDPGVVICFKANAGIEVNDGGGIIIAKGTAADPIRFTGEDDRKGFWKGVFIESKDARNLFEYVTFEYAGSDAVNDIWYNQTAALAVRNIGEVSILNCTFRETKAYGLAIQNGGELRDFADNLFSDNDDAAILIAADQVGKLDANTAVVGGNGFDGVEIYKSALDLSAEQSWPAFTDGGKYHVSGDLDIESGLKIQPGATFLFEPATRIRIDDPDAYFIAEGTAAKPITFSGIVSSGPSWNGFSFHSGDVRNLMEYCVVEYGGNDPADDIWYNINANIALRNIARLTIRHSTIRNSGGCGLAAQDPSRLVQSDNTFTGNASSDVCN